MTQRFGHLQELKGFSTGLLLLFTINTLCANEQLFAYIRPRPTFVN